MRALAVLAAALVAAPAPPPPPPPVATGPGTPYFAGMPPARFQGEAAGIVVYVNDISPYCGHAPAGLEVIACTRQVDGQAVTFLPNPCLIGDVDWYARIVCHEKGHALGWPGDHPK